MDGQGDDRVPPHAGQAGLILARTALLLALVLPGCDAASTTTADRPTPVSPGHARMVAALGVIRDRAPDDNVYQCDARVEALERDVAALPPDAPPARRLRLLSDLGDLLVLLGREREGIARLEEAESLRARAAGAVDASTLDELTMRLGSAWMRVGETENCCASAAPGACILPIEGEALHAKDEGSRKAIAIFDAFLDRPDATEFGRLQATWLLNIAAMTVGDHPDRVRADRRIPRSAFAADETFPRFVNVAGALGVDTFGLAGGVVADDFDEDGDIDLLVSNFDPAGQIRYFRNDGGTFSDRTIAAGLTGLLGGLNMVQADYDGDGHVDVLVLRGAWLGAKGRHPMSLLHNDGRGVFDDRAFDAGLCETDWPTQTAAWADVENDGDLDLFVGGEAGPPPQGVDAPCRLFRNNGDGTFTDLAVRAGVTNHGFTKGVVAADFDGDRLPDFYVSNLGQPNRLYRNRGDWTFEDVATARGVTRPINGFPVFAFDYDQDGATDILALPFYVTIADLAKAALGRKDGIETPRLYRGDGHGKFVDVTALARLDRPCAVMGCNFGDVDDDGFPDVYLGTGTPNVRALMPNLMFHNRGGRDFADVTLPGGFGHLQKGHAVAFADFDDDGDLDVFEEMGGAYRGDKFRDALYANPGFGNHWLAVRCVGTTSNRSAIGARIRAEIVDGGRRRSVHRTVGSGGSFGANPLRQHLGLGAAVRVETLSVFWPTTGRTQTFRDVAAGRLVEVVEGDDRLVERELAAKQLGGAAK
jgi:hypothetical protein